MVLEDIPDERKTAEVCLEAIKNLFYKDFFRMLAYIPFNLRTQEVWLAILGKDGMMLKDVPKNLITPEMCITAVKQNGYAIRYVPVNESYI
jgi:hypothetical protein